MHGDFQFAYYRTGTMSASELARSTRTRLRGSTIVIARRGAPIKKSIRPFLGCDDPLGGREKGRERERREEVAPRRKNEKPRVSVGGT